MAEIQTPITCLNPRTTDQRHHSNIQPGEVTSPRDRQRPSTDLSATLKIIVVDDGSTDDTRDRVAVYGDKVRYIFTPNRGVGHARNLGMAHARGEFLAFLDSDDVLYPYMLEAREPTTRSASRRRAGLRGDVGVRRQRDTSTSTI